MKTKLKILLTFLFCVFGSVRAQVVGWEKIFNSGKDFNDYSQNICTANNQSVIVTGFSINPQGNRNCLTIKYGINGDTIWTRRLDISNSDGAYSVTTDKVGNIYLTGTSNDNILTVKYSSDGNLIWKQIYNHDSTIQETGKSIAIDSNDNIVVVGSSVFSSNYSTDIVVLKYDSSGNLIWDKGLQLPSDDFAEDVSIDSYNNIIVAGWSLKNFNSDWLTIKFSSFGDTLWTRRFNIGHDDRAYRLTIDKANNIIVVGTVNELPNFYSAIVKYNSAGDIILQKFLSNIKDLKAFKKFGEGFIIGGNTYKDSTKSTTKFYIANLDSALNILAANTINNPLTAQFRNLVVTENNQIVATGVLNIKDSNSYEYLNIVTIKINSLTNVELKNPNQTPFEYYLYQNYPNPFNSATTIKFIIPKRTHIQLVIFDILGRKIMTLLDTTLSEGEHTLRINELPFNSGIYFYRITASDYSITKKLLLLK